MSCSITLTGIALDCGNVGGLKKVWIAPIEDVTDVVASEGISGSISGITMASGKKFKEFSFRKGNANFVSTGSRDDKAGTSFVTTVVTMQFNKMELVKRTEVQALSKGNTYVIALDNNGNYHFIAYDSYATGSATGQSGATMAEANMYTVTLTAETAEHPMAVPELVVSTVI